MHARTHEQQTLTTRRRAFAARLLDTPAFSWTTLGTLLCAAADEAAADAAERQAGDLVFATESLAGGMDAGATA